ncbi:MAG: type II toxin-antitoxin system VapC family toxin [Betaproteobacteria bacterium]|nr:type II toxin-antitoxin system VapC family toxin [Betaproteobacteria bacterium]
MKILLDTCTFLWIAAESPALSETCRTLFRDADNEIFLSAASAWEITVKHQLGKLPLPVPPQEFIPAQRLAHRIDALPITEAATVQLASLPNPHRDPFDRILVCQAIVDGLVILTPDALIRQYPVRTMW